MSDQLYSNMTPDEITLDKLLAVHRAARLVIEQQLKRQYEAIQSTIDRHFEEGWAQLEAALNCRRTGTVRKEP